MNCGYNLADRRVWRPHHDEHPPRNGGKPDPRWPPGGREARNEPDLIHYAGYFFRACRHGDNELEASF